MRAEETERVEQQKVKDQLPTVGKEHPDVTLIDLPVQDVDHEICIDHDVEDDLERLCCTKIVRKY